jgi:hypothetical protein
MSENLALDNRIMTKMQNHCKRRMNRFNHSIAGNKKHPHQEKYLARQAHHDMPVQHRVIGIMPQLLQDCLYVHMLAHKNDQTTVTKDYYESHILQVSGLSSRCENYGDTVCLDNG